MTDIKKINKFFGDQFDNKYSYTYAGGFIYYHWNKSNDRQLIPMGYNWSGDFDIPEPIYFESSHRSTGKLKKVEFPAVKELNQEKRTVEFPQTEPTGYLTPRYSFINAQFFVYDDKGDEYQNALEIFEINEEDVIPPEKIPLISNYMSALHNQLVRQVQEISKLDRQIANVLKVYYYESEQLTLNNLKNISIKERNKKINDWGDISQNVKSLFQSLITKGASSELIENHWMVGELRKNSYVSDHLIEATIHGILTLSKKKDPLINMAVQLAHKINPLESILEETLLNDRVKSKVQFEMDERKKLLPDPEIVADLFCNRKDNTAGTYDSEIVTTVFKFFQQYIIDVELTSIKRKVDPISKKIKEEVKSLDKTNIKTIGRWVEFYWNEYKPTNQTQTEQ